MLALLLGLFFDPEDGGNMFLQNVGWLSMDYTGIASQKAEPHILYNIPFNHETAYRKQQNLLLHKK
jgi:hypothetical protein